jgi:hypothetical protein
MEHCELWVVGCRGSPCPCPLPEEREKFRQVWSARGREFLRGRGGMEEDWRNLRDWADSLRVQVHSDDQASR